MATGRSIELAAEAMVVNCHNLTWLNIADILSAQYVKGTCLARNHITIAQFRERKRVEAIFVTTSINSASGHDQAREGSVKHIERILKRIDTWLILINSLLLDKVGKDLGIRR
jgi:hypothetical protein